MMDHGTGSNLWDLLDLSGHSDVHHRKEFFEIYTIILFTSHCSKEGPSWGFSHWCQSHRDRTRSLTSIPFETKWIHHWNPLSVMGTWAGVG